MVLSLDDNSYIYGEITISFGTTSIQSLSLIEGLARLYNLEFL